MTRNQLEFHKNREIERTNRANEALRDKEANIEIAKTVIQGASAAAGAGKSIAGGLKHGTRIRF